MTDSKSRGFVAARLRQALDRQRMTARALADAVHISEQMVSRYVRGDSNPRPATLRAMADALHEPLAFFLTPVPASAGSAAFFRSYAAATKRARLSAVAIKDRTRELTSYVTLHVDLPPSNFPSFKFGDDPATISAEDIETAATETRRFWGLGDGPIANMVRLLEHHGAVVVRFDFGVKSLDAFSQWGTPEERPFVVLGARGSPARARFDAAHELGHMVLHRHLDPQLVARSETLKLLERQAHRFAAAFLMPAPTFRQSVFFTTLSALIELKGMWLVSVGAMLMRLDHLGLVTARQKRRLWQLYAPMRRQEPMEDRVPVETPSVLREAFEIITGEVGLPPEQIAAELPLNRTDLQTLGALPLGFLDGGTVPVRLRKATSSNPVVLPFKTGG